MAPANPPFQVDHPPYPRNLPFYETEALSWLLYDKDGHSLGNFRAAEAIQAVERLYASGASRVDAVVTGISSIGDADHSAELDVTFPKSKARGVVEVIRSLHPDNWETDLEAETADSFYDQYLREVMAEPDPIRECTLSWD